jgi:tRNA (cmo5U34)-methyltransferase
MTTPSEHRVSAHLGVDAAAYDAAIRRFIPGYEEMIAEVVSILDDSLDEAVRVVDLGAGTGALAGAILAGIPRSRVILVDIDPHMLDVAAARIARHGGRAELRCATFDDALGALAAGVAPAAPAVDGDPGIGAIVASLALHHVADLDRKRALYSRIHAALAPGGVFLSADATVHEAGPEHARIFREWATGMGHAGIPAAEAESLFAKWAGEDRYYPLAVELDLLASAGFARPECFWKRGASTVFGAFR